MMQHLTNSENLIETIRLRIHQAVVENSIVLKEQYTLADDNVRQQLEDRERDVAQQLIAHYQQAKAQGINAHTFLNDNFGETKTELRSWLIKAVADGYASMRGS